MSLAEIYNQKYGGEEAATPEVTKEAEGMSKEAADAALEKAVEALSEEEAEKVAQVISVFEEEGLEFDHDLHKLAAAAEVVDEYSEYQAGEAKSAEEVEAAGRLMARALADELSKIGAEAESETETEKEPEAVSLTEKLAKAVEK